MNHTSKERLIQTLAHRQPEKLVVDFGSTPVTGIHVMVVEQLRRYFGFENKPVNVHEPYQMLGEIDDDLMKAMGIDIIGIPSRNNMFGFPNENYKPFKTFWGQEVLVPERFNTSFDNEGDLLIYPDGDMNALPSGKMPKSGYFFDALIRQKPLDESSLKPEDNTEEFKIFSKEDISYWRKQKERIAATDKGVILNPGGLAFGDISVVPGSSLKNPKGIRDVEEWYLSTLIRTDFIHGVFERQSEIALQNLATLHDIFGDTAEAIFVCGTDFGTQDSTFCSEEAFCELYKPYYKKINNWIHSHTNWKTFKHSCGAIEPFMKQFIDSGFDIINPVQINAKGMDPSKLKDNYGDKVTFWGGGVDTQKVLPFGTPEEVRSQVLKQCEILGRNGGFVFNTVHNIQANVPVENIIAMLDAIKEFNEP